jgi:hypothetical protein
MAYSLTDITERMQRYNARIARGGYCDAWRDYADECRSALHREPASDTGHHIVVPANFASFWHLVSTGQYPTQYDPDTGNRAA